MSGEPATQLVGERLLSGHRGAVAHQLNRPVSLADPIWEDLQVISGELHVEAPTEVDEWVTDCVSACSSGLGVD